MREAPSSFSLLGRLHSVALTGLPANRCKLPNVDPTNGIPHKSEPDRTLRKVRNIDKGAPLKGCMGMNLCPLFPGQDGSRPNDLGTWLEVGMELEVLGRREHVYIKI